MGNTHHENWFAFCWLSYQPYPIRHSNHNTIIKSGTQTLLLDGQYEASSEMPRSSFNIKPPREKIMLRFLFHRGLVEPMGVLAPVPVKNSISFKSCWWRARRGTGRRRWSLREALRMLHRCSRSWGVFYKRRAPES